MPNVKRAVGLFTRQLEPVETVMEAVVVSSSPPIRVCVVLLCEPYLNIAHGYVNCRW